jgi:hypothetical protein
MLSILARSALDIHLVVAQSDNSVHLLTMVATGGIETGQRYHSEI